MRIIGVQEERAFDLHRVVDHATKELADLLSKKQLPQRKVEQDMFHEFVGGSDCHAGSHGVVAKDHQRCVRVWARWLDQV